MAKIFFRTLLWICLLGWNGRRLAAQVLPETGTRSAAMGNASVTQTDAWAAFNNQAGLAFLKLPTLALSTSRPFLLNELADHAGVAAYPSGFGTVALSIQYDGFQAFNQQKIGLAYARKISESISGGIQFDYFNTSISNYGKAGAVSVEAGALVRISKPLSFGFQVFNPVQSRLGFGEQEHLPVVFRAGLTYEEADRFQLSVETEKNLSESPRFKAGLEYKIIRQLSLRGGIMTNPFISSFGLGLQLGNFQLDLASSYHQQLGVTPQLGISYALAPRNKHILIDPKL